MKIISVVATILVLQTGLSSFASNKRPLIGNSLEPEFQRILDSHHDLLPLSDWYPQHLKNSPSSLTGFEMNCETQKNSCELEIKKWLQRPLKSDQIYYLKKLFSTGFQAPELSRFIEGEKHLDREPPQMSQDAEVILSLLKKKYPQIQAVLVNGRNLSSVQVPLLSTDEYFQWVLLSDSFWPLVYWGPLKQLESENLMFQSLMGRCDSDVLVTHPPELDQGQWACPAGGQTFRPRVHSQILEHTQKSKYWIPATLLGIIGASYFLKNKEIEIHGFLNKGFP